MDPYIGDSDTVLVAVVYTAYNYECSLRWIRLGEMPLPVAQLDLSAEDGVAPVVLTLVGFNSDAGVGDIVDYEWDFTGDEVYDSQGPIDFEVHTYNFAGGYSPILRITTEFGMQDTDSVPLNVVDKWTNSWGGIDFERLREVAFSGDSVYAVGTTNSYGAGNSDLLLVKYNITGEFQWARAWGFSTVDNGSDIVLDELGGIYTICDTSNGGSGSLVLQKWESTGDPAWSRHISHTGQLLWNEIVAFEDSLYVLGTTGPEVGSSPVLIRFSSDGVVLWAKRFGTDDSERSRGLAVVRPLSGDAEIHVVSRSGPLPNRINYYKLSDSGSLLDSRNWTPDAGSMYPEAICVSTAPHQVFIAGYTDNAITPQKIFLIEQAATGSPLARTWDAGSEFSEEAAALTEDGGFLVIGGAIDDRAAILRTTKGGLLVGARSYGSVSNSVSCNGMAQPYDSGILLCGLATEGSAGSWSSVSLTAGTTAGSWSALTASISDVTTTSGNAGGTLTVVLDGTHDTGGGISDGLLALAAMP